MRRIPTCLIQRSVLSHTMTGYPRTGRPECLGRFLGELKLQNILGYGVTQIQHFCSLTSLRGAALPNLTTTTPRFSISHFDFSPTPLWPSRCTFSCGNPCAVPSSPCSPSSSLFLASSFSSPIMCTSPSFSFPSLYSPVDGNVRPSHSLLRCASLRSLPCMLTAVRFKMVKSASYRRPPRASPTGQARKPHIGPRRLSAEYVTPGVVLVKQRKVVAFNLETKRRKRHFKMYPGENVGVTSSTHLVALAHGRVKYTHDVSRDVMMVNVLPERKEELLREDLWRYRTEHVRTVEENRHICFLRMKATHIFPKELVNPPTKPELRPYHFTKRDIWENPTLPDVPIFDDDR